MDRRPICYGCRHLKDKVNFKCDAFPGGIPVEILGNKTDHRKPVEGDNGIIFEAKSPDDEDYAKDVFRSVGKGDKPQR